MELSVIPTRPYAVVEVEFQNNLIPTETQGKTYDYRTRLNVKPGDAVVVEVNSQLKIVTVMRVKEPHQTNFKGHLKWLVAAIDVQPYIDQMTEERAIEQEEQEIEQLAIQARKIKAVEETFKDNPALADRFAKLLERKRGL